MTGDHHGRTQRGQLCWSQLRTRFSARTGKPRVYEIAKEFGVESSDVLAKLQEMGEFTRSAASTVEPEALRQLWEHFEAHRTKLSVTTA